VRGGALIVSKPAAAGSPAPGREVQHSERSPSYTPRVTRDELISTTKDLIAEGERLQAAPSMGALRLWLQLSDDTLAAAWGSMDRYHLAWLSVGKPKGIVRGRPMTPEEEAVYVREVASQKTAALRMSLDAVERQGMPFRGETGGVAPGQGMGEVPGTEPGDALPAAASPGRSRFDVPPEADELAAAVRRAREEAARHDAETHRLRAPRPEKMQR
jgi:hypothetical protein